MTIIEKFVIFVTDLCKILIIMTFLRYVDNSKFYYKMIFTFVNYYWQGYLNSVSFYILKIYYNIVSKIDTNETPSR